MPATAQTATGASTSATATANAPPVGSAPATAATMATSAAAMTWRALTRRMRDRALAIPRDRAREALAELGSSLEPEQLAGPRDVELPPRLAVRHRGVPFDL